MYTLLVILIVLASLLMIFVVLIQESKGGGLSSNFSSSNAIMGVRKTTDFIEKTTWGLAIVLVVISVACSYVVPSTVNTESVIEKSATESNTTNPNNLPGFGTGQSQQTAPAGQSNTPATPKAPASPAK